jgi:hypothetical protein
MKLETLRDVLLRHGRIKLFVASDAQCLCTYISRPQPTADGLVLATDSSLSVLFADGEVTFDAFGSGALTLRDGDLFTRRIQTHRRHVAGRDVPTEYFARANQL